MKTFGEKLRELRIAAKMTQKELAEASGLAQANVSQYEASEHQPSLAVAQSFAKALGVGLEVFSDTQPPPETSKKKPKKPKK